MGLNHSGCDRQGFQVQFFAMKTVLIALVGVVFSLNAFADTMNWSNAGGGDWNDPANWSPNQVPEAGDIANITANGSYTVMMDTDVTLAELNVGGPSGQQTVSVVNSVLNTTIVVVSGSGTVNLAGSSDLSGGATVEVGGELNFTGSKIKRIYGLTLVNHGTVNHGLSRRRFQTQARCAGAEPPASGRSTASRWISRGAWRWTWGRCDLKGRGRGNLPAR
jgi:hypothetical protein